MGVSASNSNVPCDKIAWLERVEAKNFSCNSYHGLPEAPAFSITPGELPVIVSAPHAVTQLRDGRVKPSDDFTGAIALALAHESGCHAIVACRFDACDPNWDPLERSAYKRALVAHVRERGIRACIDLHGMVSAWPALVAIGTADGATVAARPELRDLAARIFRDRLDPYVKRYGKQIVVDGDLAARNPNTVTQTVARECGIPCLQIELSTLLRVPRSVGGIPRGEKAPPKRFLDHELKARSHPDPDAVLAAVDALAELVRSCT